VRALVVKNKVHFARAERAKMQLGCNRCGIDIVHVWNESNHL